MKTLGHSSLNVKDKSIKLNSTELPIDYRSICDKANVGLYELQNGRLTYVNSYFCAILGYERPNELIGKTFRDLVFPGDHERYNLEIQAFKDVDTIGENVFRMSRKDGTPSGCARTAAARF